MGIKMKKIFQYCVYTARMRFSNRKPSRRVCRYKPYPAKKKKIGTQMTPKMPNIVSSPWPIKFGRVCRTSGME